MGVLLATQGWTIAAVGFAAWAAVMAALSAIDRRRLDGENTWSKPFKFAVSLTIHFATFAVLARSLPAGSRESPALTSSLVIAVAAALFAQGYITVQAARRRRSHYNTTTSVEAVMLAVTGLCAVLVLAPALVVGLYAAEAPLPRWSAAMRAGVSIGLLAGAVLTTVTGIQMGGAGSHFPGPPPRAPRLMRLTGWSLDSPDLRPAHFLANHMMQAVPLAGAGLARLLPPLAALVVTVAFGCAWTWTTLAASRAAMAHRPLPKAFQLFA